jgi:ribosomal-protein-alanine N-acetyltransferase
VTAIDLDSTWLSGCLALDQRALGGFWTDAQWRQELLDRHRLCLGLADRDQLLAVACGWLVVDELQITVVAVDPQKRRLGLGSCLLLQLLRRAQGLGARRATLEVSATNSGGMALYSKFGFVTAGRRSRYYSDGSDALIQWVELEQVMG